LWAGLPSPAVKIDERISLKIDPPQASQKTEILPKST
jgi:hypothetical protein